MIPLKMPKWVDSIRGTTTFLFCMTYCSMLFSVILCGVILLLWGNNPKKLEAGQELIMLAIANFTGAVMGSLMSYFFKERNKENKEGQ